LDEFYNELPAEGSERLQLQATRRARRVKRASQNGLGSYDSLPAIARSATAGGAGSPEEALPAWCIIREFCQYIFLTPSSPSIIQ